MDGWEYLLSKFGVSQPTPPAPEQLTHDQRADMVSQRIAVAKAQLAKEMPAEMAGTSIQPMGLMGRLLSPKGTMASYVPGGGVQYSPEALAGADQGTVTNTLAHELTHVRQARQQPWYQPVVTGVKRGLGLDAPYNQRSDELEAFQTENDRTLAQHLPSSGDIQLPGPRKRRAGGPMMNWSSPALGGQP